MLQLRAGHEVKLSQAVQDAYSAHAPSSAWGKTPIQSECDQLQSLRSSCIASGQSAQFLVYACAVYELAQVLNLPRTVFPWSNSLGVSRSRVNGCGLYFELLNVMYNAGAAAFNESKHALAASIFAFTELQILPKVARPPPELQNPEILSNLRDVCTALAIGSEHAWAAFQLLQPVLNAKSVCTDQIAPLIVPKAQEFGTRACYEFGSINATSRRSRDRQLAKGALEKCVQLNPTSEYALKALELIQTSEVGTRTNIKKLRDVEPIFDPASLQERDFKVNKCIPEFEFAKPVLFKQVLPPELVGLPYTLSLQLQIYLEREILQTQQQNAQRAFQKTLQTRAVHAPKSALIEAVRNQLVTKAKSLELQLLKLDCAHKSDWLAQVKTVYKVLDENASAGCTCSGPADLVNYDWLRKAAADHDFAQTVYELYVADTDFLVEVNKALANACTQLADLALANDRAPPSTPPSTPQKGTPPEKCSCYTHLSAWFAVLDCGLTLSRIQSLADLFSLCAVQTVSS